MLQFLHISCKLSVLFEQLEPVLNNSNRDIYNSRDKLNCGRNYSWIKLQRNKHKPLTSTAVEEFDKDLFQNSKLFRNILMTPQVASAKRNFSVPKWLSRRCMAKLSVALLANGAEHNLVTVSII